MPKVNVIVKQGTCTRVSYKLSVGTAGCACCVGMIGIMENGTIFCGHLDSSSEPTNAGKQAYCDKVRKLMEDVLPPGPMLREFWYVQPENAMRSSNFIIETIVDLYKTSKPRNVCDKSPAMKHAHGLHCTATVVDGVKTGDDLEGVGGYQKEPLLIQKFSV